MKKRLLALALCLLMMSSLLPVTAAAADYVTINSMQITASGLTQGPLWGQANIYQLNIAKWSWDLDDSEEPDPTEIGSFITSNNVMSYNVNDHVFITKDPVEGETNYVHVLTQLEYDGNVFYCSFADNFSDSSGLNLPGYETRLVGQKLLAELESESCAIWLTFSLTKKHEHSWQFEHTGSSLTAKCSDPNCTIGEVTVKLNAQSVTLPDSPFNATLEVSENFKEAFPNAQVTGPKYVYFESGKPVDVTRDSFTPKAGQYQAQAYIDGLPGGGEIAARAVDNEDGIVGTHVDLWVDYTAVDPKVTAQTGDNRPIELMMMGLVFFSALSAAAFVLDSKRRSRQ